MFNRDSDVLVGFTKRKEFYKNAKNHTTMGHPFLGTKPKEHMQKSQLLWLSILATGLLVGCASPTVVQSVKPGDAGLTCPQLQNEYADALRFKKEASSEKGVTGGNVARLLFWPSIIGTYMNANEAIAAADNRLVNLSNLMSKSNCAVPAAN